MTDTPKALIVLAAVAALLLFARNAFAGEWFDEAAIYVDVTADQGSVYCMDSSHHASHLGARVDIYTDGPHTFRGVWVHNSCVEEEDDRFSRDVLGVGYEYRLW